MDLTCGVNSKHVSSSAPSDAKLPRKKSKVPRNDFLEEPFNAPKLLILLIVFLPICFINMAMSNTCVPVPQ